MICIYNCFIHAGRLSFDELGERQKERRTGVICDEFQKFCQHLPLTGLELVSLQFNKHLSLIYRDAGMHNSILYCTICT